MISLSGRGGNKGGGVLWDGVQQGHVISLSGRGGNKGRGGGC